PVGNAVHRRDDHRVRAQQRLHGVDDVGDGIALEGDDDDVHRTHFLRIVGGLDVGNALFFDAFGVLDAQLDAVLLHGFKVRTACDQADVSAGECQLHAHIAADGTGTIDTYLHGNSLKFGSRARPGAGALAGNGNGIGKRVGMFGLLLYHRYTPLPSRPAWSFWAKARNAKRSGDLP